MKAIFSTNNPVGYIACCEAVRDMDFTASNPTITVPTLVIIGSQDPATPPAAGEAIAKQIKGAKLAAIDAAHIANIEQPKIYAETVINFLKS
jgi:3-oxoadipate enol-lactonase